MKILISRDGAQYGPYDVEEARGNVEQGRLRSEDWAWDSAAQRWVPLGELLSSVPSEVTAPPAAPVTHIVELADGVPPGDDDRHSFFEPVILPFRQRDWLKKMWWIPLLNYIPGINLILLRGWRLAFVRRIARREEPSLPSFNLGQFLLSGSLLWCMTGLYALVPVVMIAFFGVGGFGDLVSDLRYLWDLLFTDKEVMPFDEFVVQQFWETIIAVAIDSLWIVASFPLYRAAMVRYAVTGKLSAFFNVWKICRFIGKNPVKFAQIYAFSAVLTLLLAVLTGALAATVFGAFLIPILVPGLYYWSTASEFGLLGRHLADSERLAVRAPVARRRGGGVPVQLPANAGAGH